MSTFSGLNTATTALWAQRRALDVTGQNVANVNTDGYSRQRADLQSVGGATTPAFFSTSNGIGGGVTADSVSRIRDAFLENRALTEHANSAALTVADDTLSQIQDAFREPGETGIQSLLSDMWSGFSDVANNPQDLPSRSQLIERAQTLVEGLHSSRASLESQWTRTRDDLGSLVQDVNATAKNIATMNAAIQRATQANQPTNELADKRDALVLQLATQVGASARPGDDGMVNVVVGGVTLVSGATPLGLAVAGPGKLDDVTAGDVPRVVSQPGGTVVRTGGTVGGEVAALGSTIPGYAQSLDQLASDLATQVNAQHAQGYDLTGASGGKLLGPATGTVTAANLTVLVTDPSRIAASSVAPSGGAPAIDHGNADALAQLRTKTGNPDTAYRQMVVQLGVRAATASRDLQIQTTVTQQVDTDRQGVSGVDLDEEMTNMLSFQHAYSAAARMVSAIDETLDVLINRTGKVGL